MRFAAAEMARVVVTACAACACLLLQSSPASSAPTTDTSGSPSTTPMASTVFSAPSEGVGGAPPTVADTLSGTTASTSTSTTQAPSRGPLAGKLDMLIREHGTRIKAFREDVRAGAERLRDSVAAGIGGIARIVPDRVPDRTHSGDGNSQASTVARPASKVPVKEATKETAMEAAKEDSSSTSSLTTPQPQRATSPSWLPTTASSLSESRTVIGAPRRCGPGEELDGNGKCRGIWK